jgi:uncharacterized protein (DUF58 family)
VQLGPRRLVALVRRGPLARLWRRGAARLAPARRALRRVFDKIPVTPLGALVIAGGVLCWIYMGAERLDQVLTIVAEVALGLVALSILSVVAATLRLWRRARRARSDLASRVEAGVPTLTGMSAPSLRFTPLVRVRWEWEQPADVDVAQAPGGSRLIERVVAGRRGLHEALVRRFVVEDSLALSRLAFRVREELNPPMRVMPSPGRLRQGAVVSTLAGGEDLPHPLGTVEGDRLELRRYGPGDSARLIVWKIFGRNRRLMIRVPERALARAHSVAAYLVTGEGDEAAAAAARVAVETGALGLQWVLGADGVPRDAHREDDALELIAASGARGELTEALGLQGFIQRNERHGTVRYLIFAPARDGEWVDRVAAIAARRRGLLDVIIAGDGIGRRDAMRWRGLLFRSERFPSVAAAELQAISTKLASRGVKVAVLDRPSGQVVTLVQLRRAQRVA